MDYDLTDVGTFEAYIIERLRSMIQSGATDAETLRVLDGHLTTGERELHLKLDVQRSHHEKVAASLVNLAESNVAEAQAGLDRSQHRLDRATRSLAGLEAKLARHDPEGNNHV